MMPSDDRLAVMSYIHPTFDGNYRYHLAVISLWATCNACVPLACYPPPITEQEPKIYPSSLKVSFE
jgi:hypothetical protein